MLSLRMRLTLATAAFGLIGGAGAPAQAGADPLVIPGIGQDADLLPAKRKVRAIEPVPQAAIAPQPVLKAAAQPGQLGGGFIELLMTGRAPGRATAISAASLIGQQPALTQIGRAHV